MHDTLIGRIRRHLMMSSMMGANVNISAVALATAWAEDRSTGDPEALFRAMAQRIQDAAPGTGLQAAADWLRSTSFASLAHQGLANALRELQSGSHGPIDWSAEFAACFAQSRMEAQFWPSLPIARAINRVIDIPLSERTVCVFDGAATIAWNLSGDREVSLLLTNHETTIVMALLARAACRPLEIGFVPQLVDIIARSSPYGDDPLPKRFDHIITVPPFGMRVHEGDARGMPVEVLQIERLAPRALQTFTTIVPDGALFREGRQEVEARRAMVAESATTVMSLPSGIFMPYSALATSLVRLEPRRNTGNAQMISARMLEKAVAGRSSEQAIVRHLEQFQGLRARDAARSELATHEDLEANNFSLLPERYVKSEDLVRIEDALKDRPQLALEDIATIERSKAPLPLRDGAIEDLALSALEIAPSDIVDGLVREPKRRVAFDPSQKGALAKVAIKPGDILVSIKGNVGIVGHVNIKANLAVLFDEPWIVSQSLAIIRLKPDGPFATSEVLAAILTAPWVREKLESMSGGSTVRSLPISAIRSLPIPVPTTEEIAAASEHLTMVDNLRHTVGELTDKINQTRNALWHSLWNVAPNSEMNNPC